MYDTTQNPATTIDPTELRPLRELAYSLPGGRGRISARTLTRWIVRGFEVSGGRTVRLRAECVGGGWRTSHQWIDDFIAELTRARLT